MKLSDAILLGDSMKAPAPHLFLNAEGSCGCAIGGAFLACGENYHDRGAVIDAALAERWPWVTLYMRAEIGSRYFDVAEGRMTIEELADYVRSIEPAEEPEPEELPEEAYWSDSDTTREMMNSIKGR